MQSWRKTLRKGERWPFGPLGRKGWTLIEILIVIAVVVVLTGISIPFMGRVMQTYRLNGATRQVVSEIRMAQSVAVSRGGVGGFHWGGDPFVLDHGTTEYRIEREAAGNCPNPPTDVILDWWDLSRDFANIQIISIQDNSAPFVKNLGGVLFTSRGASVNPCTAGVKFPVTITLRNDATMATRTIQVRGAGSVKICPEGGCP